MIDMDADLTMEQAKRLDVAVDAGWMRSTLMDTALEMAAKGYSAAMERAAYSTRAIEAGRAFLATCFTDERVRVERDNDWYWYERVDR